MPVVKSYNQSQSKSLISYHIRESQRRFEGSAEATRGEVRDEDRRRLIKKMMFWIRISSDQNLAFEDNR